MNIPEKRLVILPQASILRKVAQSTFMGTPEDPVITEPVWGWKSLRNSLFVNESESLVKRLETQNSHSEVRKFVRDLCKTRICTAGCSCSLFRRRSTRRLTWAAYSNWTLPTRRHRFNATI